MKTYKTWEVIKMLTENPKLKFELTNSGYEVYSGNKYKLFIKDGHLSTLANCNLLIGVDDEWILVQEPVSFMEASKAFMDGKNVRCEYKNALDNSVEIEIFTQAFSSKNGFMNNGDLTFYMINNGKWYIED